MFKNILCGIVTSVGALFALCGVLYICLCVAFYFENPFYGIIAGATIMGGLFGAIDHFENKR